MSLVWCVGADYEKRGFEPSHLFTTEKKPIRCEKYVQDKVFAIDFDEKAVRVGRTLNLIVHLNTLDYEHWDEKTKDEAWSDIYGEGWKNCAAYAPQKTKIAIFVLIF
jgi:type I restriction enzyme M protein